MAQQAHFVGANLGILLGCSKTNQELNHQHQSHHLMYHLMHIQRWQLQFVNTHQVEYTSLCFQWHGFTYISWLVGICSISKKKTHSGSVTILTGNEQWSGFILRESGGLNYLWNMIIWYIISSDCIDPWLRNTTQQYNNLPLTYRLVQSPHSPKKYSKQFHCCTAMVYSAFLCFHGCERLGVYPPSLTSYPWFSTWYPCFVTIPISVFYY